MLAYLPGKGWAATNSSADDRFAYVGNFWSDALAKVRLEDGAIVATTHVDQKESLSGIAQFPWR